MDQAAREAAGRAVLRQMSRMQLNRADVLRNSGVDNKTLQALLDGTRWPHVSTRAKVEAAIGWQPGDIERAARGELAGDAPARPAGSLSDAELIAELALRLGRATLGRHVDDRMSEGGDGSVVTQLPDRSAEVPADVAARQTSKKPQVQERREEQDQNAEG